MKRIHEIFTGRFAKCYQANVQRCEPTDYNLLGRKSGYTEHWPQLRSGTSVVALAIGDTNQREIWCGRLMDEVPSLKYQNLYRFIVDRFDYIGTHDLRVTPDGEFYGNKGGGGSRVVVLNRSPQASRSEAYSSSVVGENERRAVWVRKNHRHFRDPVYRYWDGKCAILGYSCNNLLVASHIKPWSMSTKEEKVDPNNGLLLSVALDRVFDSGLIGFKDDGTLLLSDALQKETMRSLGILASMAIPTTQLTRGMRKYLRWHREYFSLV